MKTTEGSQDPRIALREAVASGMRDLENAERKLPWFKARDHFLPVAQAFGVAPEVRRMSAPDVGQSFNEAVYQIQSVLDNVPPYIHVSERLTAVTAGSLVTMKIGKLPVFNESCRS